MHRDLARDEFRRQLEATKLGRVVLLSKKAGRNGIVVDDVDPPVDRRAFEFALTGWVLGHPNYRPTRAELRAANYALKKLLQRTAGENGRPTLPQVTDEAVNDLADAAMQARKRYFVVSAESDFTRYVLQDIDTARRGLHRRKLGDRARRQIRGRLLRLADDPRYGEFGDAVESLSLRRSWRALVRRALSLA